MTGSSRRHTTAYRRDWLWAAALVHRLSGLALALFLPLHFLALGLALEGEAKLQAMIVWTANPWVKLSEAVLVFALVVHALGGLRLLVMEFGPWRGRLKATAIASAVAAIVIALAFLQRMP